MIPPRTLTVCRRQYTVHLVTGLEDTEQALGTCDRTGHRISYDPGQAADALPDTLLHEVLHALLYHSGAATYLVQHAAEAEELVVSILTPHLLDFLRDNPEFINQLQRGPVCDVSATPKR